MCTRGHTAGLLAAELCLAATQSCLPRMNPLCHTMRPPPYLERAVIPAPCGDDESGPDRGRSVTTVGAHPQNRYKQTSTYTCLEKRARW